MKFSRIVILLLALLTPHVVRAQNNIAAERAWKPFIDAFRTAVKKRDRAALKGMMAEDFFTSGGIGDDDDENFVFSRVIPREDAGKKE